MTDARSAKRIRFIVILALVLAVGIVVWRIARPQVAVRELKDATITMIDSGTGTAGIEFVHPKSGQKVPLSASVGPKCTITLDGKPVTLKDLRIGDKVDVRGVVTKSLADISVEPQQVTARRATSTTSAPTASRPAATAPGAAPTSAPSADQP
jgi:hypothetical protein